MGEIIKYPASIFEKERELAKKEFEVALLEMKVKSEKTRLEVEKTKSHSKIMTAFVLGILLGFLITVSSLSA